MYGNCPDLFMVNSMSKQVYYNMVGKLRMSIFLSILRLVNIIFLEVMPVLTLKGSKRLSTMKAMKAMKAMNPMNLAAKTDATKNKPADTYSNIKGNGIKDED
ncbi:hypothetical protein DVH24_029376 [Malus domestica]|uniref:Uncharacterized protein n=1 Tax=Malus domestica TaxID=3750 RepID=A0A498HYK0_MALDO|nr:hypothetical protein DVH24_029376 [Malus domestica]